MNWVILLARNNLYLTRKAIKTVLAQDIGDVKLLVINNGSTDGTPAFLQTQTDVFQINPVFQVSVAKAWNTGLRFVFATDTPHCLVVNNDIELRPDTYRHLVADGGGFVTAVGVREKKKIEPIEYTGIGRGLHPTHAYAYKVPDPTSKRPHPDFSCYLIRRETWETVGEFDERFEVAFVEDNDYHVRLHRAGITAWCLDLPYLHHGSMTIKNAEPAERKRIQDAAARNREYFFKKYGVHAGSPEYYALFGHPAPEDRNAIADGNDGTTTPDS